MLFSVFRDGESVLCWMFLPLLGATHDLLDRGLPNGGGCECYVLDSSWASGSNAGVVGFVQSSNCRWLLPSQRQQRFPTHAAKWRHRRLDWNLPGPQGGFFDMYLTGLGLKEGKMSQGSSSGMEDCYSVNSFRVAGEMMNILQINALRKDFQLWDNSCCKPCTVKYMRHCRESREVAPCTRHLP